MLYPQSTILYISIFLISTILAFEYHYWNDKVLRKINLAFLFLVLFIPAALRYNIGTDYALYEIFYEEIKTGDLVNKEFGFIFLMKCFIWLGLDFQFFIAFVSGLTYYFVIKVFQSLPRESGPLYIALFVLYHYFHSYCIIRQILAVSIANYALVRACVHNNKKGIYYLFLFSVLMHYSAILLFAVYLFRKVSVSYTGLIIISLLSVIATNVFGVASLIISNLPEWVPYAGYAKSTLFNAATTLNSGLGIYLRILLGIFPLAYAKQIVKNHPNVGVFYITVFCYSLSVALSGEIHIFHRLRDAFTLIYIYAFCYTLPYVKEKWLKCSVNIIHVSFAFYIFIMICLTAYSIDTPMHKGLGITPYQTFFSK